VILGLYFIGQAYPARNIGYLWYNPIGCVVCVVVSLLLQAVLDSRSRGGTLPAA
jgi:solute:Na+ symporter, SSS family